MSKYDRSRDRKNYTFHPGRRFQLDWDGGDTGPCYLVALDAKALAITRLMWAVFPKYHWLWGLPSPRRDWDNQTQQIWTDIQDYVDCVEACLVSCTEISELNTHLARIADSLQTVDGEGNPVSHLAYLQHLQTLGAVPGAGDTIQTSLIKAVEALGAQDLTLQELIDEINANPNLNKFKDFLETLTFIRDLTPSINLKLPSIWPLLTALFEARYLHNDLTIKAYQATALRGIQNALTPFEDNEEQDEETIVKEIYDNLDKLPWLLTAVAAVAEPTPSGETVVAAKMGATALSWLVRIKDSLLNLWNSWANQVENPIPASTVTGSLLDISRKLARDTDAYAGSSNPVSLFGILQGLALTQLHDDNGNLVSSADSLSNIVKELEELQNMQIGPFNINVDNCCEGSSGEPPPGGQPIEDPPPADDGGSFPPGFPDQATYDEYKCRAAHQVRKYLADTVEAVGTNVATTLDNRTWQNAIEIYDYLNATKYNYLPNAISYNLSPGALTSLVQQVTNWFIPAWRNELFISDGPQQIPITGYTHFRMLRELANTLRTDNDLICNLMADANATQARSSIGLALSQAITTAFNALPADQQGHWDTTEVSDWLNLMVTNAFANILFTDSAFTLVQFADCSGCITTPDCQNDWVINLGTLISGSLSGDTTGFTVQSQFSSSGGCNRQQVQINIPSDCGNLSISHSVPTPGYTAETCGDSALRYIDANGVEVKELSYTPGELCLGPGSFYVRGQQQFDLVVSVLGNC